MDKFTKEQSAAIYTKKSRVLVMAAAGSGKTKVLTERVKHLLDIGVSPYEICAITYTNNAAEEMRRRVNNDKVFIGTIHSLANKILNAYNIDTSDLLEEEDFNGLFDRFFENNIDISVKHVLVDEFQDICNIEYHFIREGLNPENFFFIGDYRQAIYGFKGGNSQLIKNLSKNRTITVFPLTKNFRSKKKILEFATKRLRNSSEEIVPECARAGDGIVEIDRFTHSNFISRIIDLKRNNENYKDWFILCRSNYQVDEALSICRFNDIPAVTFKQGRHDNEEIQSMVNSNRVKVLTVHSAKGLEAKNVMVYGCLGSSAEESRINYVAATRAKDRLIYFR